MNNELTIEKADYKDAARLIDIKRSTWLDSYVNNEEGMTAERIKEKFNQERMKDITKKKAANIAKENSKNRQTFVAKINGKTVGYCSPRITEGKRRVGALYVDPTAQGRGVGSKLLKKAIDWHGNNEDVYVYVVAYNRKAQSLYEKFGFESTGVKREESTDPTGVKIPEQIEMKLSP